jgi:hypothetical protein
MRAAVLVLVGFGCGGGASAPQAAHRVLGDAPADGSDDIIVAHVDGHPVWGSCVAAQAVRTHGDREAALDDCIAFELLAWQAAKRGYADDPDVALAWRTAMVGRVLDDYEDHVQPADLEPVFDKLTARMLPRLRHGEYRGTSYLRMNVGSGAPPGFDDQAHAVADKIADALAGQAGLSDAQLMPIAQPIADAAGLGSDLAHASVPPYGHLGLDKTYTDAMFAIPEVGRASAHAVRTKWGWDVIVFTSDVPPANPTDAEVTAKVLEEGRATAFPDWVANVATRLGIAPALDPQVDQTLDEAP